MIERKIVTNVAVIALICFAIISAGCSGTDNKQANAAPSSDLEIIKGEKTSYARELLEESMKAIFAEDHLVDNTNLVRLSARYQDNELYWNTDFEVVPNDRGGMKFGFKDGVPENAFYAGPIIMWYKTSLDSPIEYTAARMISTPVSKRTIVDVIPVEWGFEYYETPPPQVLKIMSDNDIKLHY